MTRRSGTRKQRRIQRQREILARPAPVVAGTDLRELIPWIIKEGVRWVQAQRDVHRPGARALDDREVEALERFFGPTIMNLASIKVVPRIENPPFYSALSGVSVIDFAQGGGIAFIDTILITRQKKRRNPLPLPLVFHELVHVVQYDHVGVDEFISRYVQGWLTHGQQYASIPIERQAYELQARYELNPSDGFSVFDHVHHAGVP